MPYNPFSGKSYEQYQREHQGEQAAQAAKAAEVAARPTPPARPAYSPVFDMGTMGVQNDVNAQLAQIQYDPRAMNRFRMEALRRGPSAWADLMNRAQAQEVMTGRERGQRDIASQQAGARGNLAMRGGLSGGARERLAKQGMQNYFNMSQDLNRTASQNRYNVGVQDEQNRMGQLQALPGMEVQALSPQFDKLKLMGQAKEFDLKNLMTEKQARNAWDMNVYQEENKRWGTERESEATEKGGGSWLCTNAANFGDFSRDDAKLLRKFLRKALKTHKPVVRFYTLECKELISRMDKSGESWESRNYTFVRRICKMVSDGKMAEAYELYRTTVIELIEQYWPECTHPGFLKAKEGA